MAKRLGSAGLVVAMMAVVLGTTGCTAQANVDKIGLYYTGGWHEGVHFKRVVAPGSGAKYLGWGNTVHWLPVNQRNYIVSKVAGEGDRKGEDTIQVPAKGGVLMTFEVSVYFKLNTHTDDIPNFKGGTLRRFYEQICIKYDCTSPDGWDRMLNDNLRKIIEASMRQRVFDFTVDELFANAAGPASGKRDAIQLIQNDIATALKDNVNRVLGGEYFCGPTFDRKKSDCPDFQFVINSANPPADVATSYNAQRIALNAVQTARNNALAKKAEAEGVLAAQRASQSALTPAYLEYLRIQAMQKCAENANCTIIFGDGKTGINVQPGGK